MNAHSQALRGRNVHDAMLEPTCGREAGGAAFARAHDRSPFSRALRTP
jgi:hypothetical protein